MKKSGQMSIWATAGRARGVASVIPRLFWLSFSGRGKKKGYEAGEIDSGVGKMDDGERNCWVV